MYPAGQAGQLMHFLVQALDLRFQKVVVRVADVAAHASLRFQRRFDRRSLIGQHAAEDGRSTAVTDDLFEKADVGADAGQGAGGIEQHEAELEHQAEFLEQGDCPQVLRDIDLLVEGLQSVFATRFEPHVDQIEAGGLHFGK